MLVRTDTTTTLPIPRPVNLLSLVPLTSTRTCSPKIKGAMPFQQRVTTELDQGRAELTLMIPSAYTNVFAVPFNSYGNLPLSYSGANSPT